MKYMLMMNATKEGFDWYAKWPKKDLQANMAFMRNEVDPIVWTKFRPSLDGAAG